MKRANGGRFLLFALLLALCIIFGGATRSGSIADTGLQLIAVPLLLWALWGAWQRGAAINPGNLFCLALVLVPLLQLVPLPPDVWVSLPLRDRVMETVTLTGLAPGWRPLSVTPHATWLTLTSLIPALAIFLAAREASFKERRTAILCLVGVGVLSSLVGLLQVALGAESWLSGLGLSRDGEAVGFFANRNHFAALLYCLIVLAAAFAVHSLPDVMAADFAARTRAIGVAIASFVLLVFFLSAEIMSRSRAGLGLTIIALLGIVALVQSDARASVAGRKRFFAGAVLLVLIFGSQFALYRILERFEADPLQDARLAFARNTWDAALAFMPFGSGLGSFVPIYPYFEKPEDALLDRYVNRAHNDGLEVWLETGVLGPLLMAVFVIGLSVKIWQVWGPTSRNLLGQRGSPLDILLMRAATLLILLLLMHSLVDYPLRTTAMMAVFALACGLLFEPPSSGVMGDTSPQSRAVTGPEPATQHPRATSAAGIPWPSEKGDEARAGPAASGASRENWAWPETKRETKPETQAEPKEQSSREFGLPEDTRTSNTSGQRWGADIEWPEAWRKPAAKLDNDSED